MGREVLAAALLVLAALAPARAMDLKVESDTVTMSGSVVGPECNELETILLQHQIRRIVLRNSGGGDARTGYCVGDLIRVRGLATVIRGRCASSCSRMWLGGVERTVDGPNSRVGLHSNHSNGGGLSPEAPQKLRDWIVHRVPDVSHLPAVYLTGRSRIGPFHV